jgi:Zn-dependent protease with chaperone function
MDGPFRAVLYDGLSAAGREGTALIDEDLLRIRLADGTAEEWPLAALTLVAAQADRATLARDPRSDARLGLAGDGVLGALIAAAPRLRDQQQTHGFRKSALVAAAILALLVGVWLAYPPLKAGIAAVFPARWADRIGEEMASEHALFGRPCAGEAGLAALSGLSARLSAAAGLDAPVRVHVHSSKQVNAFAAPGGHVALLDGLIQDARSPDEVAGVLAHEIGHVRHRHPLERLIDVAGIQLIVASISGDIGAVGTMVLMLSYGEKDEAQADRAALDILERAGIATGGLADFFDRMAARNRHRPDLVPFLRTHPPLADRSTAIRARTPADDVRPALDEAEWRAVRQVCAGLAPR